MTLGTIRVHFLNIQLFPQDKPMILSALSMVEAAGVEPASEIAVSQERSCFVRFLLDSLRALRTDKMDQKLVR